VRALHATTIGQGDRTRSEASAGGFNIRAGGQHITMKFAMACAEAACVRGQATVGGSADISDLTINGRYIAVSGEVNQTVWLPLGAGRVVINEQLKANGKIVVRALRVVVTGSADIVICEARAGVACGQITCDTTKDFVTGGGWVTGTPSGARACFGVAGGTRNGELWGHFTFVDHGPGGPKVKGVGVTAYTAVNADTRRIEGPCEIDGRGGHTFRVEVADNGEPGRSDTFRVSLSNGYEAGGNLGGGNIKLHVPCR
jgi:hypothetical protein